MQEFCQALEDYALSFPETTTAPSCKKTAIKARKKSFVFLLADEESCEIMLKLGDSLEKAEALAASDPELCGVGKTQWVTLKLTSTKQVGIAKLKVWIEESFRLLAPKTLLKSMD